MPVPSSVIYGMRYEPRGRTLDVVFRGGRGTYRYFGVPLNVWRAFVRAPSKGTYLNTVFKDKGFGYEKLEEWVSVPRLAAAEAPAEEASAGQGFRDLPDANVWGFYD